MTIVANPDKLRELSKKLSRLGEEMAQMQRQAQSALQSSGWDGPERHRFESELQRDLKTASALGRKLSGDYTRTLERKAKALDDFRRA